MPIPWPKLNFLPTCAAPSWQALNCPVHISLSHTIVIGTTLCCAAHRTDDSEKLKGWNSGGCGF